jgi:putative tryptophan/tyrosine transport system substrate-binding protein
MANRHGRSQALTLNCRRPRPHQASSITRAFGVSAESLRARNRPTLPVQAPTKYELIINLKTTKALGLTVPDKLLAVADAVIE